MLPTEAGNLYLLSARESVRQAWLGLDRVQAFLRAQTNDPHWVLDLPQREAAGYNRAYPAYRHWLSVGNKREPPDT
jgi:hypothetical protein